MNLRCTSTRTTIYVRVNVAQLRYDSTSLKCFFKSSNEHIFFSLQMMQCLDAMPPQQILRAQSTVRDFGTGLPSPLNHRSPVPARNLPHVSPTIHHVQNTQQQQQQQQQSQLPQNINTLFTDPRDIPNRPSVHEFPLLRFSALEHHAPTTPHHMTNPLLLPRVPSSPPVIYRKPSPKGATGTDREELKQFVETFKQKRNELGFSQRDVSISLEILNGTICSPTTICRIETNRASLETMHEFKPLLTEWMIQTEQGNGITDPCILANYFRRKKKTVINPRFLEESFLKNPNPNSNEIVTLSISSSIEEQFIRVWFKTR